MSQYKKISGSKIAFELVIEEKEFEKAQKQAIEDLRKGVSIKGFRKGQAPESAVVSAVGLNTVINNAFDIVLNRKYRKFLTDNQLNPIAQPKIDFDPKAKMPMKVKVEIEIFPGIELGDYRKIKVEPIKIEVKPAEIDEVIQTIMADMKLGTEVDRAAKKRDLITVSFIGKDKSGTEVPNTGGKEIDFRLGMGHFLPDLEKAIEGMKAGESKQKKPVKFPKDYHAKDMAGSTVYFDVEVHKVKEIDIKALDEGVVEKVTGKKKPVAEFRTDIENLIKTNKSKGEKKTKAEEYKRALVKKVKIDLPESWIGSEVEARLQAMKNSPEYQASPDKFWASVGKNEEQLKKEFHSEAEFGLKSFLALSEIVKQENIELNKDEEHMVHQRVHQRLDADKNLQVGHDRLMENESLNAKIDKFLNSLFVA